MATMMAQMMATTQAMMVWVLAEVSTNWEIAVLMVLAMVLIWVMLPMPKAASAPNTAKMTPSHFQFLPRPFLM